MSMNFTNAKSFNIKFLEWVELHPEDLASMGFASDEKVKIKAYISPDVKSLHLIWVEITKDGNWAWYHEMVDYVSFMIADSDEDISLLQCILQDELFDDSMECGDEDSKEKFYMNVLSDYGDEIPELKIMTLKEIWKDE